MAAPKWGEATWNLFHGSAMAVQESVFEENPVFHTELIQVYIDICDHLPCPECRQHAQKEVHEKIQWSSVRRKIDLQSNLHAFHNRVNQRTGKERFNVNYLSACYAPVAERLFTQVIPNFVREFGKPVRDIHYQYDNAMRVQCVERVRQWFEANKKHFQ